MDNGPFSSIGYWFLKGATIEIILSDIMDILFAGRIPVEECGYLESLISDHHLNFKQLYPDGSITMKMHSMIHLPRLIVRALHMIAWGLRILLVTPNYSMQLITATCMGHPTYMCMCMWCMKHADMDTTHCFPFRFGPLINHWTTRFEAKHKYFKNLANVMGNYTNICYSLALRHQLQHCYLSLNNETLPGEENEVGPGDVYDMNIVVRYTIACVCLTYTTYICM